MLLCVQFPNYSDEPYMLRDFAQIFLPLLYVYGNHIRNIEKAQKEFDARQWGKLWKRAQANAAIGRARLERNLAITPPDLKSRRSSILLPYVKGGTYAKLLDHHEIAPPRCRRLNS
jgi:hypothetical protein